MWRGIANKSPFDRTKRPKERDIYMTDGEEKAVSRIKVAV